MKNSNLKEIIKNVSYRSIVLDIITIILIMLLTFFLSYITADGNISEVFKPEKEIKTTKDLVVGRMGYTKRILYDSGFDYTENKKVVGYYGLVGLDDDTNLIVLFPKKDLEKANEAAPKMLGYIRKLEAFEKELINNIVEAYRQGAEERGETFNAIDAKDNFNLVVLDVRKDPKQGVIIWIVIGVLIVSCLTIKLVIDTVSYINYKKHRNMKTTMSL